MAKKSNAVEDGKFYFKLHRTSQNGESLEYFDLLLIQRSSNYVGKNCVELFTSQQSPKTCQGSSSEKSLGK